MGSTIEEMRQTEPQDTLDEAAIRAALEAALAEDGRPLSRVAPEIGVPYGTVSSWRGGTYAGNTKKVAIAVQAWLHSRTARARARAVLPAEPQFVMTRTASRIWDLLEFAQTTPTIGVVVGGAGVGKTRAFVAYQRQLPNTVWIATMQPLHTSMHAMLREITAALDLGFPGRTFDMAHAVVRKMRGARGLLIIDEAQHLPADALDQVRSLADAAMTGVVLGGNRQLSARLGADRRQEQLAQIYSRIGMRLNLNRPLREDIRMLLDAWGLEAEDARDTAMAIALKPGAMRGMTHVLRVAFALARANGEDKPGVQQIEAAWQQFAGNAGGVA